MKLNLQLKSPKNAKKQQPASLQASLTQAGRMLLKYRVLLFFVVLAGIYSLVVLRINTLSQAEPSASDVTLQTTAHSLKVDPTVVQKIQQLQDNSVSVQALFQQARNNPFNE